MTAAGGDEPAFAIAAGRVLKFLATGPAVADPGDPPTLRRVTEGGLRRLRCDTAVLDTLRRRGLIRLGAAGEYRLAPGAAAGRAAGPGRGDQRRLAPREIVAPDMSRTTVVVDEAESPLGWLHRRRDREGRPLITDDELAAGERLRADFTRGGLMPSTTSNWRNLAVRGASGAGGAGGAADLTDAALAARMRFGRALDAIGQDLSGLVVDVACFLKGLEVVELERRWPPRSAKIVLRIALSRLAEHYGIATRPTGGGIRHWGAEGYRPAVTPSGRGAEA